MIGKLVVIYSSGDHRIVDAEPDLLHQLQQLVGGWIEIVRNQRMSLCISLGDDLAKHLVAVVDDVGRLRDEIHYNGIASAFVRYSPLLVGDVVLCRKGFTYEGEPDIFPLTADDAKLISLVLQISGSREVKKNADR